MFKYSAQLLSYPDPPWPSRAHITCVGVRGAQGTARSSDSGGANIIIDIWP